MENQIPQPVVYVVAGPNGAGKTTFATKFLPDHVACREFLNADLIAAGLAPFAPETQNIAAARLMLGRIRELTARRQTFGFETTLSGRGYRKLLSDMRDSGYRVVLFFLWLPNADFAVSRVARRVQQGGHNIPEPDIRRRFDGGLRNFFHLYQPVVDEWQLYNASGLLPQLIASDCDGIDSVEQNDLFEQIQQQSERISHD